MEPKLVIVASLLITSTGMGLLSLYAALHFKTPGAKSYTGLMASAALYSFGYMLELCHTSLEGILFSLRIEYLGIPFLPVFWVMMAVRYAGYASLVPRWVFWALFVIPVFTLIFHYTNAQHHLFYATVKVNNSGPFPLAEITKGVWYQVNEFYQQICFITGNLIFLRMMLRSVGPYRMQATTMFIASMIPWVGDFIYQYSLAPYGIDIVPFTFAIAGPLFALALFRFRMFDFVPIARHTIFDCMRDPVFVLDTAGRLADVNNAGLGFFPDVRRAMLGRHAEYVFTAYPELVSFLRDGKNPPKEIRGKGGVDSRVFELSTVPVPSKTSQSMGTILMLHDVTQQKQLLEKLRELANMDGLTGIYNHRFFLECSNKEMRRAVRQRRPLTLILLDLDYFKRINDAYGHQTGDKVLCAVAETLRNGLRTSDILGRYGGEEFAAFLPETGPETGVRIAQRLHEALRKLRVPVDGHAVAITASMGVAGYHAAQHADSVEKIFKEADEALYRAKAKGRNRIEVLATPH